LLAPMIGGCEYTWGDFPTEGILRNGFGGGYEAEEAKANLRNLRAAAPNLKQGFYTWLWSAGANSKVYHDHPDWFVTKTREGAVANYFPGPEVTLNYFRSYLDPASLQEAVNAICRSCKAFDLDIWYLDGGGTNTVAIDWEKCAIDSPLNAIALHQTIRETIQRDNPDRAVFFNTPYNPQGDFGYLESFSDIITAWRSGAAWMYKFKLFQHRNPLHYPIYIYWLGTVSGPLEEYMVGTGLLASNHSHGDRLRDVGYISARHEVRQLRLMDAHVAPDWRFDPNCTVEALPLEQGGTGLIFLKHHGDKPLPTAVSFDTAPYAIPAGRPVHQWLLTVKNARKYACQFGEPDLRKGYAQSDWLADRVLAPKYLGTVAMNEPRFSRELELPPEQAVLYEFSSVPAIIWSYRGHPAYHRLAGTPAVRITGDYEAMAVDAEEPNTEIAIIVPPGQLPDAITVNGQPAQWRLFRENGAILAIVKLEKAGHNALASRFRPTPPLAGTCQLQAKVENGVLKATVTMPSGWTGRTLLLSVSDGDSTVWSREQPVTGTELAYALDLPHIVRDGRYTLSAGLPWGEVAGVEFEVKGVARPTKLEAVMPPRKTAANESTCEVQAGGMSIRRTFTALTEGCGTAEVKPRELSLELSSNLMYETYFNQLACGMELTGVKRYVKVALDSNFWFFNQTTSCQVGRHSPRYDNPTHYLGLYLDFGTAQGYTTRVAGGYGKYDIKNQSVFPPWGAKRLPSRKWMLCNHTKAMERERTEIWLDMQRMGAPQDWNGSLIASLAMTVVSPDRKISLRILETSDELPGDETAATPLALDVSEPRQIFSVKQLSAPPDNSAWEAAPVLGEMRDVGNRALKDPMPIQVKALRDATTLFVRYDATEPPGKIFDCLRGRDGLPYFSDGVELLLGLADQRDMQLHIVVDMEGHDFVHTTALTSEAKKRTARLRDFPYRKKLLVDNPEKWTIILEIPLNALGVTEPATLPFNAMANRVVNGKMVNLSLAPVFFSKDHFQLRL
ncbi:MAG: hypothetical protein IJJ33_19955, partial [Victivallales bacterium]|nr:hypothetical protein [Victivallales bacterium]